MQWYIRVVNVSTYLLPWSDRDPPDAVGVRRVAIWETRCRKVSCCVLQGLPTCCTSKSTTVILACISVHACGCQANTPLYQPATSEGLARGGNIQTVARSAEEQHSGLFWASQHWSWPRVQFEPELSSGLCRCGLGIDFLICKISSVDFRVWVESSVLYAVDPLSARHLVSTPDITAIMIAIDNIWAGRP